MMKRYMAVRITICEGSSIHGGRIHYEDDELGINISADVSYEEGMKQLRKLEQLLHRPAKMDINQYNTDISYKELYGFID